MSEEIFHISLNKRNEIELEIPSEDRQSLGTLIEQLTEFLDPELNESKRLFPTAYPNDPERDAGYQALAQSEMIDQKTESIRLFQKTLMNTILTIEEAETWMRVLNDIRLVIGTRLDISQESKSNKKDFELEFLYENLSYLTSAFVEVLDRSLPNS